MATGHLSATEAIAEPSANATPADNVANTLSQPLKNLTNSVVIPAVPSLRSRAQVFSKAEHFPQFVQLSASRQSRTSGQSGEAPSR